MNNDKIMELATAEAGPYWGTESHMVRFALRIREETLNEAAKVAEKFHASAADCAAMIRDLGVSNE